MLDLSKGSDSNFTRLWDDGGNLLVSNRLRNNHHFRKFLNNVFHGQILLKAEWGVRGGINTFVKFLSTLLL